MFHHLFFVVVQIQLLEDQPVALHQLAGGEPGGDPRPLGVVLDQVAHAVQTAVHRAAVAALVAEIHPQGRFLIFGHMDGVVDQLVNAFIFGGGNGDHRHAQQGFHLVDIHRAAVGGHLVHHIQCHHHGHVHLQQLHGQVQVALNVGGIHDIDNALRLFLQHEIAGDDLLAGIGGHGIDARQIGNGGIGAALDGAVLAVHRHPGKVAHVAVGAGQLVKERRLAAVLVAHQRKGEQRPLRQRVAASLGMEFAALAETRVRGPAVGFRPLPFRCRRSGHRLHVDFVSLCQPQRQLIPVQQHLHGVAHGGVFDHRHLRAGDQPHIQKVLPQRAAAPHGLDNRAFSDFQFLQRHSSESSHFQAFSPNY